MSNLDVPVLIVGGGGTGLTMALFLADAGVASILVERRIATSNQPKAHYINQRTMEILRQHGVAEAVYEVGMPMESVHVRWCTTMGGDGPLEGRELYVMDGFGGGSLRARYESDSPCLSSNFPQHRFEPLLREHAERREHTDIRFGHELVAIETIDDGGVSAEIRDLETAETYVIRARYVVAADGGRSLGPALGITMEGPSGFLDMVNTVFKADLSRWMEDDVLITWYLNPEGEGSWSSGAIVGHGPTWGRHSEEWYLVRGVHPDDPERFDDQASITRLRELLRVPDLEAEITQVNHWSVEAVVADKYQVGDVFLCGDAAHRHPPTTGLGLNTGIQDAHNLAWKLASVVNGYADASLLTTYQQERRPIGQINAAWAMMTFENHLLIDAAKGLFPGQTPEQRTSALRALLADTPEGATRRAKFGEVVETQRMEFQAHDIELGFFYPVGAFVPDGTEPPRRDPMGGIYTPTGRPGHRFPHVWLTNPAGEQISTLDLVRPGRYLLVTNEGNLHWTAAAREVAAKLCVPLDIVTIGDAAGSHSDTEKRLEETVSLQPAGAMIIRPDGHTAFRASASPDDPAATITDVLRSSRLSGVG